MGYVSEWLVELSAHNGSAVVPLRYSGSGYVTGPSDSPANTIFDARIAREAGIGVFSRQLFGDGRTMGHATIEPGALVLSNADRGLDALKGYAFDGRSFKLMRLSHPRAAYSSAEVMLTGTMDGIDTGEGSLTIRIPFYDRRRDIDIPIQSEKYAGTTTSAGATAEGSADMKDQVKPLIFGRCYSVPATIVNDFNMFLQFSASAVNSITLYDGGVPLINDGDVANLSALASATGNPGHYRTCLAQGIARPFGTFNGRPAFTWTADVVEGSSAAQRRAGAIVQRMLAKIGITGSSNIDSASFSALDSLATAELGIYLDRETTVLSAAYEILRSVGGFIIPNNLGRFTVGRLDEPGTPIMTITEPEILTGSATETPAFMPNPDTDGAVPANSVLIKWRKNWHTHTDSDLGHCANFGDPTRGNALKQEWREVREESSAVAARHLLSRELEIETMLVDQSAAEAEAARRLNLYSVNRDVVRIGYPISEADSLQLNETVELVLDRFDYTNGKAMRIIGRADDFANEKTILTLWG
jgi:hypothetical protein